MIGGSFAAAIAAATAAATEVSGEDEFLRKHEIAR